jgi:hypothetical protein
LSLASWAEGAAAIHSKPVFICKNAAGGLVLQNDPALSVEQKHAGIEAVDGLAERDLPLGDGCTMAACRMRGTKRLARLVSSSVKGP